MKFKGQAVIALGLAAALVAPFGMTSTAFAAEIGNTGSVATNDNKVTFVKDLVVTDVDSDYVPQVPGVTFNYSIAPGTAAANGTYDGGTNTYDIKAGPTGATIGTAAFTKADTLNDGTGGKKYARKNVEVDLSKVTFSDEGVYRYVITETTPTTTDTYGYTYTGDDADIPAIDAKNNTRYLDVYVEKQTDGTFRIVGYVITKVMDDKNKKDGGFTENSTPVYEDGTTTEGEGKGTPVAVSEYRTHDVTVKKVVTGTITEPNKAFNISMSLPGQTGGKYQMVKPGGTTEDVTSAPTMAIKHNEVYTIKGLPLSSNVKFTEDNYTTDYDAPTYTVDSGNSTAMTANANKYDTANITSNKTASDSTDVVITNHRKVAPPTGVLMQFAPFAAMVALAALLGSVLFMKRRNN